MHYGHHGDCGGGHHGEHGHHGFGRGWHQGPGFRRRFFTREELLQRLDDYATALETEAKAVRERLAELRGQAASAPAAEAEAEDCG